MEGSYHPQQLFATLYPWRERRGGGEGREGERYPALHFGQLLGTSVLVEPYPVVSVTTLPKKRHRSNRLQKKSSCTLYYTVTLIEFSSWKFFSCGPLLSSCSLVYKHFYSGKTHFIITNMYHSHFINLPLMIFAFGSSLIIALLTIVRALWAYLRVVKKRGNSTIL